MRTRVKICGITRRQDACIVVDSGADALGLVFYPHSPRYVDMDTARGIARTVSPFVTVTGLFVNAAEAAIREVLAQVPLGLLQFHGQETNADCVCYGVPFIKSIAMRAGVNIVDVMAQYPDAAGFLLDAWQPSIHGGGGEVFDWDRVPVPAPAPLILAGGLTPGNVETAIRKVRPYAVDVSSGVEETRGIKSAGKIRTFMKGVASSETDSHG